VGVLFLVVSGVLFIGSVATGFVGYRILWEGKKSGAIAYKEPLPSNATPPPAQPRGEPKPHGPTREANLVASAQLLYNFETQSLSVLKTENVESVVIERRENQYLEIYKSYTIIFLFRAASGPFEIKMNSSVNWLPYIVMQNDKKFVRVLFDPQQSYIQSPKSHEIVFSFYKKATTLPRD
jgi:hypothetical protein